MTEGVSEPPQVRRVKAWRQGCPGKPGIGREHHVLGLHRGVDDDAVDVFDVEIDRTMVPARTAFTRNIAPSGSAGMPTVVLPAGMTSGLPVGIGLSQPATSDRDLLSLALAVERAVDLKSCTDTLTCGERQAP